MSDVEESGWERRWREGNTPWDAGAPAPALVKWLASDDAPPPGRALVPGCGAGYDVVALATAGWEVTGLDLAESVRPRFDEVLDAGGVAARTKLEVADFFEAVLEPFDLVYDYTFLCALPPAWRTRWAERMAALVRPGGTLTSLVFPMVDPPEGYEGPPFPLHPADVKELAAPSFKLVGERDVTHSHPGREGKERLLWFRRRDAAKASR